MSVLDCAERAGLRAAQARIANSAAAMRIARGILGRRVAGAVGFGANIKGS
jgi:hypothetical protein